MLGTGDAAAVVFPHAAPDIVTDEAGNRVPPGSTSSVGFRLDGDTTLRELWIGLDDLPAFNRAVGLVEPYPIENDAVFAPVDGGQQLEDPLISAAGFGVIWHGLTLQEVADATGSHVWAFEWSVASPRCGHAQVGGMDRDTLLLHLLGDSDDLDDAYVSAVATASPEIRTPFGPRVGDLESDLFEVNWGKQLVRIPNEYTDGHIWRFDAAGLGDLPEQAVAFAIEDGVIVSITGGRADDVHRFEGCA